MVVSCPAQMIEFVDTYIGMIEGNLIIITSKYMTTYCLFSS